MHPGCQEMVKVSDTEFMAKVVAKVGPVNARFGGRVTLSDLDPPNGYTITGEGTGGAAGFAQGGATVTLAPDGEATALRYSVAATVGGKLAQIGSRLIDATARKMADDFFSAFTQIVGVAEMAEAPAVEAPAVEAPAVEAPIEAPPPAAGAEERRVKPVIWIPAMIVAIILVLLYFAARPAG